VGCQPSPARPRRRTRPARDGAPGLGNTGTQAPFTTHACHSRGEAPLHWAAPGCPESQARTAAVAGRTPAMLEQGGGAAARQVRLLLLAALAGEHILYLGPPGTAKSELGRRLAQLYDGPFFERLLTRFSVPEELFGPLSMRELENDRYVRQVTPRALPGPCGSASRQRGSLPELSRRREPPALRGPATACQARPEVVWRAIVAHAERDDPARAERRDVPGSRTRARAPCKLPDMHLRRARRRATCRRPASRSSTRSSRRTAPS